MSVLRYYGKNEKYLFSDDLFILEYDKNKRGLPVELNPINLGYNEEALDYLGMKIDRHETMLSVEQIARAVDSNKFVLVPIDRYDWDFEFNDDYYQKVHYPHFVLIYGYDNKESRYSVIHANETAAVSDYIDYDVLNKANADFNEYLHIREYADIVILSDDKEVNISDEECRNKYINLLKKSKGLIEKNIAELEEVITHTVQDIKNVIQQDEFYVMLSFFLLEKMVNTEEYINKIFFDNEKINGLQSEMRNSLYQARFMFLKAMRRSNLSESTSLVIEQKLKAYYQARIDFYKVVLELISK